MLENIGKRRLLLCLKISLMSWLKFCFNIQTVFLVTSAILISARYFVTCTLTLSSIVKQAFESFMSMQFLKQKYALLKISTSYLGQS